MVKKRINSFWPRVMVFLAVLGPGIIAACANNDAGGISTYSIVGADFGGKMMWILFLVMFSTAVTQEMGVRIGLVTRQGLGGVIREYFGVRWVALVMLTMLITNLGTMTAEFSGLAESFEIFGISKYWVVPLGALVIWLILYKGSFKTTQRVFLLFSFFYLVYIVNGFIIKPDFAAAAKDLVTPTLEWTPHFLITMIALIGTTITPWGQFFIQSYVVDKGLDIKHYPAEKLEVYLGSVFTIVIGFFIILSTAATLHAAGIKITDAKDAALALKPLAGNFAQLLFAFGLFTGSMLGAFILPVATAYATCQAFGWEYGFDTDWKHGKYFYTTILLTIALPALFVLIPGIPLFRVMLLTQSINGILLPIILIFVMKIINNKEIMGNYVNKPLSNIIAWLTVGGLILCTALLVATTFFGMA